MHLRNSFLINELASLPPASDAPRSSASGAEGYRFEPCRGIISGDTSADGGQPHRRYCRVSGAGLEGRWAKKVSNKPLQGGDSVTIIRRCGTCKTIGNRLVVIAMVPKRSHRAFACRDLSIPPRSVSPAEIGGICLGKRSMSEGSHVSQPVPLAARTSTNHGTRICVAHDARWFPGRRRVSRAS